MKWFLRFFLLAPWIACVASSGTAGDKDEVKPINLEKLNTAEDDLDPFPVNDTNLLYASKDGDRFEILWSKRGTGIAAYPPGKVFRPFLSSKDYSCRSPFVWKGSTLYFAQDKVPDKKFESLRNFDLYQTTNERAPLPLLGVGEAEDEMFPWVAAGGREFYFSRKTKEGWKLFVAMGPGAGASPGPIGKAQPVGFAEDFHHASLTPNGLGMVLEGMLDDGRIGIFRSKRAAIGGKWSAPEPIKALNVSRGRLGDMSPTLTPDGTRLFFVSDREGGKGRLDIWMIPVKDLK